MLIALFLAAGVLVFCLTYIFLPKTWFEEIFTVGNTPGEQRVFTLMAFGLIVAGWWMIVPVLILYWIVDLFVNGLKYLRSRVEHKMSRTQ